MNLQSSSSQSNTSVIFFLNFEDQTRDFNTQWQVLHFMVMFKVFSQLAIF